MTLRDRFMAIDAAPRLTIGVAVAVVLFLAILYSAIHEQISKLDRRRLSRESSLSEMMLLKQRHLEASSGAQKLANRLAAVTPDDSPANLIEEIGIKGKSSQIKPLKGEDHPGFLEDAAEVRIEALSANEMVNLLYRLEQSVKPVIVKRANLKTRYDNPAKLDVTLGIALLKPVSLEKQ